MVLVGKKTFADLSVWYLELPLPNLEKDLFQNFQENEVPRQLYSGNSGKFLTGFLFLDYVNGVYTGKSVEGDRLVRVDASLTAVNTA